MPETGQAKDASVEEHPDIQTLWANLLANAADPRAQTPVLQMFPSILQDLGPREVKFLDALYAQATRTLEAQFIFHAVSQIPFEKIDLLRIYADEGLSGGVNLATPMFDEQQQPGFAKVQNTFWLTLDILRHHDVLREVVYQPPGETQESMNQLLRRFHFTDLGAAFVKACRPPA